MIMGAHWGRAARAELAQHRDQVSKRLRVTEPSFVFRSC